MAIRAGNFVGWASAQHASIAGVWWAKAHPTAATALRRSLVSCFGIRTDYQRLWWADFLSHSPPALSLKLSSRIASKFDGSEGRIMSITSVASSTAYPSPAAASEAVASSAAASATVSGAKSPAVINSVSAQLSPGTGLSSVSDIQNSINGINASIQIYARLDWSKLSGITPEEVAQAQSIQAGHIQAAEGATIARVEEEGLQGISFDFLPIDFPAPSGSQSSSIIAAAPQAAAATRTPGPAATPAAAASSATPPSAASVPVAASSQSQANPQPSTPTLSSGATATSNAAASIALSVLKAANPPSSAQTYATQTARQTYDIYA